MLKLLIGFPGRLLSDGVGFFQLRYECDPVSRNINVDLDILKVFLNRFSL